MNIALSYLTQVYQFLLKMLDIPLLQQKSEEKPNFQIVFSVKNESNSDAMNISNLTSFILKFLDVPLLQQRLFHIFSLLLPIWNMQTK